MCLKFPCRRDLLILSVSVGKTWWFLLIHRSKKMSFVDTSKEKYEFYRYIKRKGWVFSIGEKMWVAPIHVVKKLWFLLICWKKKVSSSTFIDQRKMVSLPKQIIQEFFSEICRCWKTKKWSWTYAPDCIKSKIKKGSHKGASPLTPFILVIQLLIVRKILYFDKLSMWDFPK